MMSASVFSGRLMERALDNHAGALRQAAASSGKVAKSIGLATWALVGVTAGL